MPIPSGVASTHTLTDIANAIRFQNGETKDYKPCEMTDAIRDLEWEEPSQAYALLMYPSDGETKQKLWFIRATQAPQPMTFYNGRPIAEVYTGFEETVYTSNSQVPWYSKHDDIGEVKFFDDVKPKSCAYWFYMFRNCTSFDVAKLDTSEATSFGFMFYYCSSVTELDLRTFQTGNVTNLNYTFYFCTKLETLKMGNWDMTNLQVFAQAFRNLTSIVVLDLSGWTMPEWTSTMQYTFYNCSKLTTIYAPAGCDLTDTAVNSYCFSSCTKLVGRNGTTYNSSKVTAAMARIDGLGGQQGYFTAKA